MDSNNLVQKLVDKFNHDCQEAKIVPSPPKTYKIIVVPPHDVRGSYIVYIEETSSHIDNGFRGNCWGEQYDGPDYRGDCW